jgi:hypothetical protein
VSIARVGLEILLPVAVLLLTPRPLGLTWPLILLFFPDLGWSGLAASTLLLATGLIRAALLARAIRGLPDGGQTDFIMAAPALRRV